MVHPARSPQTPEADTDADDATLLDTMRIPVRYLANLFTAGEETPVRAALHKLLALRRHMRAKTFGGGDATLALEAAGITPATADAMYRLLAVARYEDRFVIPTVRRENALGEDVEALKGHTGYPDRAPVAPGFEGEHA